MHIRECALLAAAVCAGCSSSISSRPYTGDAIEGILYKLPAREFIVTATYDLKSCIPAGVALTDLAIASRLVPSVSSEDWFEVDPSDMASWFNSVDPAEIGLSGGMLTKVGLTARSEARAITEQLAKATLEVAQATAGVASLFSQQDEVPKCRESVSGELTRFNALKNEADGKIAQHQAFMDMATERFKKSPTEDNERLVQWARQQIASAYVRRPAELQLVTSASFQPRRSADHGLDGRN